MGRLCLTEESDKHGWFKSITRDFQRHLKGQLKGLLHIQFRFNATIIRQLRLQLNRHRRERGLILEGRAISR